MKRSIVPGFILLVFMSSCGFFSSTRSTKPTAEEKEKAEAVERAKALITKSARDEGQHPNTYVPISFSTLDSSFENLSEDADPNVKYPPHFNGFKMIHIYKENDIFNEFRADTQTFFFDKDVTKIIKMVDTIHSTQHI